MKYKLTATAQKCLVAMAPKMPPRWTDEGHALWEKTFRHIEKAYQDAKEHSTTPRYVFPKGTISETMDVGIYLLDDMFVEALVPVKGQWYPMSERQRLYLEPEDIVWYNVWYAEPDKGYYVSKYPSGGNKRTTHFCVVNALQEPEVTKEEENYESPEHDNHTS